MDATILAGRLLLGAPANATLGIEVTKAVDGRAEVSADVASHLTNVVGSMHASGLAGLVDAAGLAAIISAMAGPDEVRGLLPLGRTAELRFLAPARGSLAARCELDDDARAALAALVATGATARFATEASVVSEGQQVCTGRFEWTVRRTDQS